MAGVGERRGKRLIAVLAGICLSLGGAVLPAQDAPEGGFVGNAQAKTYHRPDCKLARRLTARNKVELATLDEAAQRKFKPCPVCKPDKGDAPADPADDEKPDGDMPKTKAKAKKGSARGALKPSDAAPGEADDADGAAMPTKAKGKRGAAKTSRKKGALSRKGEASRKADAAEKAEPAPADEKAVKFSRDIAPILAGNCTGCHNPERKRGQFDMTTFQKLMTGSSKNKVVNPGKPDESLMILKVRGEQTTGGKMPPGQRNLAPETIAKLEEWIKAGARLDAGFEPTATLDSIAPTPESRRRAELARMSPEERDKALEASGLERWKKASARTSPDVASGRNFLLFSNLPKERADRLLKAMEAQRTTLGGLLGPHATALTGPEKISLFVFKEPTGYVEFVRSLENREVEAGVESHGRLDVEQPYLAAVDPLNGGEESAAAAALASGATPKKSGRSRKKEAAEEAPEGPDRTLAGLLSEGLAASAANVGGKPPRWLSTGLGAYLSSLVEARGGPYYRKLREETAAQFNLGWEAKSAELLGGEGSPEAIRAIGFSACEWLATSFRPRFPMFVQGMLEGGEKLDEVIRRCFGEGVTRDQFLRQWGGFIATRYNLGRRR